MRTTGGGPPNEEAGPLAKGPANAVVSNTNTSKVDHSRGAELLAQLRRRHAAARRLQPLASGPRDPLSPMERADGWARNG
jgi:hypothetical protein